MELEFERVLAVRRDKDAINPLIAIAWPPIIADFRNSWGQAITVDRIAPEILHPNLLEVVPFQKIKHSLD